MFRDGSSCDFVLTVAPDGKINKVTVMGGTIGVFHHGPMFTPKGGRDKITMQEIRDSIRDGKNTLEYLGHISELTIKGGRVVTP